MPPHATGTPPPSTIGEIVARFEGGTLAAEHWTHPAHLFVCRHVLATTTSNEEAVARLRELIEAHNARVGVRSHHGGYHETVTRYFVGAMRHADPPTTAAMLTDPALRREAPSDHWTREALASSAARTGWVEPDLRRLPWSMATTRPST